MEPSRAAGDGDAALAALASASPAGSGGADDAERAFAGTSVDASAAAGHEPTDPHLELIFHGLRVVLDEDGSLATCTGYVLWEAAYALLRMIESERRVEWWKTRRVLDYSGGIGTLGVAVAMLDPSVRVTVTEFGASQLDLIRANCEANGISCAGDDPRVEVAEAPFGDADACDALLRGRKPYDVILVSDVLYIALRDGLERELLESLVQLLRGAGTRVACGVAATTTTELLFAFKIRLPPREKVWLDDMRVAFEAIGSAVEEVVVEEEWLCDLKPTTMMGSLFHAPDEHRCRVFRVTRSSGV